MPAADTETDAPSLIAFKDTTASDQDLRAPSLPQLSRKPRPPPEAATEVRRKGPPPVADTLVDFGLPASLKEQLGQAKAALEQAKKGRPKKSTNTRRSDPRVARFRMPRSPSPAKPKDAERETQIDLALRRRASSSRSSRPERDPSSVDTVHDVDAADVQAYIDQKKAEQAEAKPPKKSESWGDQIAPDQAEAAGDEDSKRPNILVVERSLDEVILNYLADED